MNTYETIILMLFIVIIIQLINGLIASYKISYYQTIVKRAGIQDRVKNVSFLGMFSK